MSDEDLDLIEDEKIKSLLKEAREGKKEVAEARQALEAERLAVGFDRANIPESGPGLMFRENYRGEPTAEAIRAEAERYGILSPPAPSQEQQSQEEELNRMRTSQQNVGDQGQAPNAEDEIRAKMLSIDNSSMSPSEKQDALMEIVRQNGLKMDTSEQGSARFKG
jgi:hypothetical protein